MASAALQGLVDRATHDRRSAFEETFRPQDHFPEWLLKAEGSVAAGPTAESPYPGPHDERQDALMDDILEKLDEDVEVALRAAHSLDIFRLEFAMSIRAFPARRVPSPCHSGFLIR